MIKVSQLFDETLSIYSNKTVVIWGAGNYGKKMLELFECLHIRVYAVCDNNQDLWGKSIKGGGRYYLSARA